MSKFNGSILRLLAATCMCLLLFAAPAFAQCPAGQIETVAGSGVCILDPTVVPKYVDPLIIPPVMPQTSAPDECPGGVDYYEIAVRQFNQFVFPQSMALQTPVWSYGVPSNPATFNYPALTVENISNKPTRVKWINDLVDPVTGNFLPHILGNVVDQTLHWANPPGGDMGRDMRGSDPTPYLGPIPLITHVHGAHVGPESDGYPQAWWLPNANNIPDGYATQGTQFDQFDRTNTTPGTAVFQYPNDQRAATLWYHDHALGMTRLNVYAGPAGFWMVRGAGGTEPDVLTGVLPGPAPAAGEALWLPVGRGNGAPPYREIPIAIQDRSFYPDGKLFYPDNRAFFEGVPTADLLIDFVPDSDISPIHNPEVFSNTMVVNGRTWPFQNVEPVRYRLRLLNGCQSRFVNLALFVVNPDGSLGQELPFYQIGTEGGMLPNVVKVETGFTTILPTGARTPASAPDKALLLALAERADVIVDFTGLAPGTVVRMINTGPDFPFGGFPIAPLDLSNPDTTGQVMEFVVVPLVNADASSDPATLVLNTIANLSPTVVRKLSINELDSSVVCVEGDALGNFLVPITQIECEEDNAVPFGPQAALLGTMGVDPVTGNPVAIPKLWMEEITENPKLNAVETWEMYNFTMDAHPIHLHLVNFQVVDRQAFDPATNLPVADTVRGPEPWETGWKDTVISYPGEITRLRAKFDIGGLYVWHCHIVEHEDNEMMRAYRVGDTVTITSVVYNAKERTLSVRATSSDQPDVKLTATGFGKLNYRQGSKDYTKVFTHVNARPASVTVTSTGGGSATFVLPAADTVAVTSVVYNPKAKTLTVKATSSDQPNVQLTATGFGRLIYKPEMQAYWRIFWNVQTKPASVTVTSTGGGSATFVLPATDTVTITSVVYDAKTKTLTVRATSSEQPNVMLTVTGYGPLTYSSRTQDYARRFAHVNAEPASVTVTSSGGGSATYAFP